jgi:hypothetical protein
MRVDQNPNLYSDGEGFQGLAGVCEDGTGYAGSVEGPSLGAGVVTVYYGQKAHTVENYQCSHTSQIDYAPKPENSMCIVFYPEPDNVGGDLGFWYFISGPPIIKCDE